MSATSAAALASIEITDLEARVLVVIKNYGADGCISDQVRQHFPELSYSSVTARFASLEEKGAICRNGDTRKGLSGRQQQVMRDSKYALKPIVPAAARKERNPFDKGLLYAARILIDSPDLVTAKARMKKEVEKIKAKEKV